MGRRFGARPLVTSAIVATLVICVGDWLALRMKLVDHPSWILTIGVSILGVLLLLRLALVVREVTNHEIGILRALGTGLTLLGLLLLFGAGLTNWLRRFQGFVILTESESSPLRNGEQLQEFDHGPLGDVSSLELSITLVDVELVAGARGQFNPRSHLVVVQQGGLHESLYTSPDSRAEVGSLMIYQGAFGFAPRIVILKDDQTAFDRHVPFLTERAGPTGVSFRGEFTIEDENLAVDGVIDLDSLDTDMRGHSTLRLVVRRDGQVLGEGALLPGKFAEIDEGYRIGFAGLKKWSEIDISRRNYRSPMIAGVCVTVIGSILWTIAVWSRR